MIPIRSQQIMTEISRLGEQQSKLGEQLSEIAEKQKVSIRISSFLRY